MGYAIGIRRSALMATTAFAALAATAAAAQTTPPATSRPASDQPAGDIRPGDIVVTAQRRAERLQDVPLSITAISGDQIVNQDITDVTRLEQIAPGLRVGRSGPAMRPAIRGVYTEAIGINADPRIGFYIDEIYQSRSAQAEAAFVDLERVEVQKGPQGTLFGRNSLGGNIALTTATPKDHIEGGLDITGGNYGRIKAEAYYNLPLAEGLAIRLAGSAEHHDGYLKSMVNSNADLEDKKDGYGRVSLRWTPPSLDGRLEVLLHASYYHDGGHGYNNANAKVIGSLVDPSLITKPGGTLVVNGVSYPFPAGYNGGNYATGTLYPYTTALRDNIPDVNGADIGIPAGGPYQTNYDYPAWQNLKSQNYSGSISFQLSDKVRIKSITGYTNFSTVNVGDGDGGPVPISYYYTLTKAKTFTQELQLQSTDKSSRLQYTLGGFYLNDTDDDGSGLVNLHTYTTAGAAAAGQQTLYASGATCGYTYLPNTSSCAINNLNTADSAGPEHAKTTSLAAYLQASYKVTDRLTFTGGVRYTVDRKFFEGLTQTTDYVSTYVAAQNAAAGAGTLPYLLGSSGYHAEFPLLPGTQSATFENRTCGGYTAGTFAASGSNTIIGSVPDYFTTICGRATFKYATFRAAVDYKITPDNMLYASVSTGKHSGGFGGSTVPATNATPIFGSYGPEGVTAYEIGSKNKFFNGRLIVNVAAYYNVYTNVQIQGLQYNPYSNSNITTIYNGPTEKAPGVDIDITAMPTKELTLNLSANYIHARYDVYAQPVYYSGLCTISQVAGSPCYGYSGASYIASMGGLGSGFFPNALTDPSLFTVASTNPTTGATTSYGSLIYNQKTRVQNTPDIALHFGASYRYDLGHERGTITPEFNTIFSGSYLLSASTPLFEQQAYFKTDARITYRSANEKYTFQIFVNNLTNIATIGRVTTSGLAVSGTYDDPRTFGARIGYHF
jgi:iron complex outermembrane recepter protein